MVFWGQRLILRASHAGALSIPFSRMFVPYTVCVVRMFLLLCSLPVITRVPANCLLHLTPGVHLTRSSQNEKDNFTD